jgi:hypothetical protein
MRDICANSPTWAIGRVQGKILHAREDVGRHRALDKIVGARAKRAGPSLWCLARDDSVLRVNAGRDRPPAA